MPYVAINERRIPYDIDGSAVSYQSGTIATSPNVLLNQYPTWLSSLQMGQLNSETRNLNIGGASDRMWAFFFFLTELTEITAVSFLFSSDSNELSTLLILGSSDSTNGIDGTWESGVFSTQSLSVRADWWRENVVSLSFSGPVKCIKMGLSAGAGGYLTPKAIHLFGRKATGQNPDDIIFTDASGDILTSLVDFGDVPEGTTSYQQIRVKNASATKNANDINLQLNNSDFDFSYSPTGPWVSVIDISSLGPGSLSQVIYVRNHLNPPLLALGPKAARIIAAVGSWT